MKRTDENQIKNGASENGHSGKGQGKTRRGKLAGQIFFSILVIIIVTIGLCILMNTFFLGDSYLRNKQKNMTDVYQTLNDAASKKTLYKKNYRVTFERICSDDSLSILITGPDNSTVLSSEEENISNGMLNQLYSMMFSLNQGSELLEQTDQYRIVRHRDSRTHGEFIVLFGNLSDGNTIVMRCALESLKESVQVADQFLILVGLIAAAIGALLAVFLSSRITKPITELSAISRKMADLDFEARYQPRERGNEIDDLGVNINRLSQSLETTIGELKKANMDLRQDLDTRNQTERMRKDFLSNVSHELKTPIALIQGYAEGLEDGIADDPETSKAYCDVIIDESKRMNHLVQQLLALNQLEYGQDNLSMERFDVTNVIRSLIQNASLLITQNGIRVDFDDSQPVYIWSDEFFTEQALNNYLTNAIHYAKDDKRIHIYFSKAAKEPGVRVNVFNTGDPIPEDSIAHLWEKFYKVDKARTRAYGGSGIGLSVVKAVAENLNRDCGVENREDGVDFWIEFDVK